MSGSRFSSLVELCERSCATFAARPLFGVKAGPKPEDAWTWLTYAEFHEQVAAARAGLAALYCFVFLYIAARGSGIWSVDAGRSA